MKTKKILKKYRKKHADQQKVADLPLETFNLDCGTFGYRVLEFWIIEDLAQ
jgi:hypothetical protein